MAGPGDKTGAEQASISSEKECGVLANALVLIAQTALSSIRLSCTVTSIHALGVQPTVFRVRQAMLPILLHVLQAVSISCNRPKCFA